MSESNSALLSTLGTKPIASGTHLRNVDLNLLTVFDTVMQMQNITRAANVLGMSQPAVSNAVARLKLMFNDELFVRSGRGIQPTARAYQLFSPLRQALQLVQNELPGHGFFPESSHREFKISIANPLDLRLTAKIMQYIQEISPHVTLQMNAFLDGNIERQLRYQETEFVISYTPFEYADFRNHSLFTDELVIVSSKYHHSFGEKITEGRLLNEKHAVVSLAYANSFSRHYYVSDEWRNLIVHQCTDLFSMLHIISKTQLVGIAPLWFAQNYADTLGLQLTPYPSPSDSQITCYLSWHQAIERDNGYNWLKDVLTQICI